jgi:antitoxin MazE
MYIQWKIRRPMRTKIVMWGNSLGLRIPKALAEEVKVREGSMVEISLAKGQLLIRPAPPRYDLEDLLEEVTQENLHGEIDTGVPQGTEGW